MKTTETKARAGEGVSGAPAEEVKSALQGFLSEFKGFQDDMTSRLQQQEERLTMLDRKSFTAGRPALSTAVDLDAPHKKAFGAYLRSGDDDGLRGLVLEGKALNTQSLQAAGRAALQEAAPIDDVRSTAEYRREVSQVLVRRALRNAAERSAGISGEPLPPLE